jgi:hypothetical protein
LDDVTPVFLTKAQFDALEDPPSSGLYPSLKNHQISIIDEDTDLNNLVQTVPDYENLDPTNKVDENTGGIWIADRPGYIRYTVHLHTDTAMTANTYYRLDAYINDKLIGRVATDSNALQFTRFYNENVVPINAGDKVNLVIEKVGTGTESVVKNFQLRYIPPKFVKTVAPVVSDNFMNVAMVPEYASMSDNLLVTPDPDPYPFIRNWTADKVGFIKVRMYFKSDGNSNSYAYISINDKIIAITGKQNSVIDIKYYCDIFPIVAGDHVQLTAANDNGTPIGDFELCFIPPKFVTMQAPNIVISEASYSTDEVVTGETWIDGKPIYRRVIYRNTGSLVLTMNTTIDLNTSALPSGSVSEVTKLSFSANNGGALITGASAYIDLSSSYNVGVYLTFDGKLKCFSAVNDTLINFTVVAYYTKN